MQTMYRQSAGTFVLAATFLACAQGSAQNVTGYDAMADASLFLLREPAVIADLRLNDSQRRGLQQLNDEVDGPLLALRNQQADTAKKTWDELLHRTQGAVETILDADQRRRLKQISLRVRGIKLVLAPEVAEWLGLSEEQTSAIQKTIDETAAELADLQKQLQVGESSRRIEPQARQAREREQKQVLARLTPEQQRSLSDLLGRSFDPNKLGRVSFKAPEFVDSGGWINTRPLTLADLRGKVIVVHFWAFG
jgi:hypothetical protein